MVEFRRFLPRLPTGQNHAKHWQIPSEFGSVCHNMQQIDSAEGNRPWSASKWTGVLLSINLSLQLRPFHYTASLHNGSQSYYFWYAKPWWSPNNLCHYCPIFWKQRSEDDLNLTEQFLAPSLIKTEIWQINPLIYKHKSFHNPRRKGTWQQVCKPSGVFTRSTFGCQWF